MNVNARKAKKQVNIEIPMTNLLSKEEISRRKEAIEDELKASTWRELETNGKLAKNDKLSLIIDDMLSENRDNI